MPEMKQEYDLSPADFVRQPVWVGVHNYDSDEPWYEQSDEETFRPWTGPLPFSESRGFVLVAATFELADGSVYPGYCRAVGNDWDLPPQPTTMRNGTQDKPQSWSSMHGGSQLSVLLLQNPIIFIDGRSFDFQLRIPELRKTAIRSFYAAIAKQPSDVFPVRFAAKSGLAAGITSGQLDGFYHFPMWKTAFEIDTGEALLREDEVSRGDPKVTGPDSVLEQPSVVVVNDESAISQGETATPGLERSFDLSLEDFRRHPVWVRVPFRDETKPWYAQYTFTPWTGSLPVDSEKRDVRIPVIFVFCDGSKHPGYARAVPENWADVIPSPTILGSKVIQGASPKVRYGDSPLAIMGEQLPCVFIKGQTFQFWCGVKDPDELRLQFYKTLGKQPADIFPIRFEGAQGLATGIVSGEINGFYLLEWPRGKPRIYVEV